jgi:hypothetical protein
MIGKTGRKNHRSGLEKTTVFVRIRLTFQCGGTIIMKK